jgi:4-hydroxyproline epimerase
MKVIDSHTAGEPTRVIIEGGPELGSGPLCERVEIFQKHFDDYRKTAILEPRGTDALVGALLCEPADDRCAAGVIFFNNTGFLGMCGHGLIGTVVTLHYLGRLPLGHHLIETPVGVVTVDLHDANTASVENVASYCYLENVELNIDGLGTVVGDVAWGGNWFFLANDTPFPLILGNITDLTRAATMIKKSLIKHGITGKDGAAIDHIEFYSEPESETANSRNFVLCPGNAYDRSPCGTGTSAKLACLANRGLLEPGKTWVQESVIGSTFAARYRLNKAQEIIPTISSTAFICGSATLIRQPNDPFINGIQ